MFIVVVIFYVWKWRGVEKNINIILCLRKKFVVSLEKKVLLKCLWNDLLVVMGVEKVDEIKKLLLCYIVVDNFLNFILVMFL